MSFVSRTVAAMIDQHVAPAATPAAFVNWGEGEAQNVNTLNVSFTCGAGANLLLAAVVAGAYNGGAANTYTRTLTYDNREMTSLGAVDSANMTHGFIELWYLWNPPVGAAKTLAATVTKTGVTLNDLKVGAVAYANITGLGTPVTGRGNVQGNPSLTIASDAGHIAVAAFTTNLAISTPTDRQRVLSNTWPAQNSADTLLIEDQDGAASAVLGCSFANGLWGGIAVDLIGGGGTPSMLPMITSISPNPGPAGTVTIHGGNFEVAPSPPVGAPTAWLPWMDPFYGVNGTGTKTVATATHFDGTIDTYSLTGSPPAGVSINSSTGVVSINTASDIPYTTVTVRGTNSNGYIEVGLDVWVFTPTTEITAGATNLSSLTPSPGAIVVVRAGSWTTSQNINAWAGSEASPIKLVAYPGENVVFNTNALAGQPSYPAGLHCTGCHDVEIRGLKFSDTRYLTANPPALSETCNFAVHSANAQRMRLAQCEISGYWQHGSWLGHLSWDAWTVEYNHIHNNVQMNNPPSGTPINSWGSWGQGIRINQGDGSLIRRNRIHSNYGEGLGWGSGNHYTSFQILENIVYDNWSKNIYGGASNTQIHGNICFDENATFSWLGWSASIEIADEGGGMYPSNNIATNNYYLDTIPAPAYGSWSAAEGTGNVWTPNTSFSTVDQRWKTVCGVMPY